MKRKVIILLTLAFVFTFCIVSVNVSKNYVNYNIKQRFALQSKGAESSSTILWRGVQGAKPPAPLLCAALAAQDNNTEIKTQDGNNTSKGKYETNDLDKNSEEEKTFSLWGLFKKGGPFMWPILIFAAVGLGFIIERFIFFARAKPASREFIDKLENSILKEDFQTVEKLCSENDNRMAHILMKGLNLKSLGFERVEKALTVSSSVEVASMERGLNVLSALGNIVPMLGFLGTVSGMISAFADIASADQVSARIVAGGIQEALLTTAAGLIIAIPLLLFYNYFVHRIDGFISNVERIASDIVERLIQGNDSIPPDSLSS